MDGPTDLKNVIVQEACRWFASRRPIGYSEEQHFRNPAINSRTDEEATLAHAVAQYLQQDLEQKRNHDL